MILSEPVRYGLIGRELGYSFSKDFFSKKFEQEEINAVYENHELAEIEEFKMIHRDRIAGLNVTIPYKSSIIPLLDEVDELAQEIGAVNTIRFSKGRTIGFNTDAFGFRESLRPHLKSYHQKALILGTGGASKAIAHVLKTIGLDVLFVSRTPIKKDQVSYSDLNEAALRIFPFIINTTPVGTSPSVDERPDIPYQYLGDKNFLYDLIYNPEETRFLSSGREAGAQTMNGRRMLELQAEKAYEIWTDSGEK